MLNVYQMEIVAKEFLKKEYDLELIVPIVLNGRLKSTKGCFRHKEVNGKQTPVKIEMNKLFVEYNRQEIVLSVLKHELVHYAFCMMGKVHCSDGHPIFEQELKRLDIISQNTINNFKIASKMQIYQCSDCSHEYKRYKRLSKRGIYSCKCGGNLLDKGQRIVNA
ncbi:SprT-like domain-containing protein [Halobacillus rhizosphaerae]|uniref:SprT-like domain-containing protein n=1 Tax=Halobacillus rhizosphaerae TaxID=3064889 RepID=UPI00398B0F2B